MTTPKEMGMHLNLSAECPTCRGYGEYQEYTPDPRDGRDVDCEDCGSEGRVAIKCEYEVMCDGDAVEIVGDLPVCAACLPQARDLWDREMITMASLPDYPSMLHSMTADRSMILGGDL